MYMEALMGTIDFFAALIDTEERKRHNRAQWVKECIINALIFILNQTNVF